MELHNDLESPLHSIRLRGPWTCRREPTIAPERRKPKESELSRFRMPDGLPRVLGDGGHGTVLLERNFHRPTGLVPTVDVQLVVQTVYKGYVLLNDQRHEMPKPGTWGHLIGDQLNAHNRLQIGLVIDEAGSMHQPRCEVWLDIVRRD